MNSDQNKELSPGTGVLKYKRVTEKERGDQNQLGHPSPSIPNQGYVFLGQLNAQSDTAASILRVLWGRKTRKQSDSFLRTHGDSRISSTPLLQANFRGRL